MSFHSGAVWGLVPVYGPPLPSVFPLVASNVHYRVVDVQYHATLRQTYVSQAVSETEVRYTFPLPSDASVCSYKAVVDGKRTITGLVKGKQQAKAEYDQAVQAGQTATLLEQVNEEVFQISLGNIHPGQSIEVHITFVALISQDGGLDSLRLTFPSAIGPRYGSPPPALSSTYLSNNPIVSKIRSFTDGPKQGAPASSDASTGALELTVSFEMSSPIRSIKSLSHPITSNLGTNTIQANSSEGAADADFNPNNAFVQLTSPEWLTDDIVLVIQCADLDRPRCMVESFAPEEGAEEWTDAYALTLVPRFDLPMLPKQEFIFLVDRSGSMSGGKIKAVRASLQIMLKSLPTRNTLFNIWSFGSNSSALWPVSKPYTAAMVEEASKHIDTMEADFGGTKMQSAIDNAVASRNTEYTTGDAVPTSVFVLTDGESWDIENVFTTVREGVAASEDKGGLRVFTLGIGDAVSRAMCEGISRAGRGVSVFVGESEKPDQKLMGLVRAARGAPVENLTVDWGVELPEDTLDTEKKTEGSKDSTAEHDDFEVVDSVSVVTYAATVVPEAATSLFDPFVNPTKDNQDVEVGIKDLTLPPPPALQIAPALDTLPSLYPTFRTSIFAVVRRSSSESAPSKEVKIKGTILGRAVELNVPVGQATSQHALAAEDTSSGTPTSKKLLHVLAARALIRKFEDAGGKGTAHRSMTAEDEAEVKRIALRYGLASSQTSFVAIDSESQVPHSVVEMKEREEEIESRPGSVRFKSRRAMVRSGAPVGSVMLGSLVATGPSIQPLVSSSSSGRSSSSSVSPGYSPSSPQFDLRNAAPEVLRSEGTTRGGSTAINTMDSVPSDSFGFGSIFASTGPRKTRSSAGWFSRGQGGAETKKKAGIAPNTHTLSTASTSFFSAGPSLSIATSTSSSSAEPTIELFARLQSFDGSFGEASWLGSVYKTKSMPALPPALAAVSSQALDDEAKNMVWRTLLCVAYIEAKFAGERDAWEMMVEKAMECVRDTLGVAVDLEGLLVEARDGVAA